MLVRNMLTHNTHVDDTKHHLKLYCNNRNVFGNNRNIVFQYRSTLGHMVNEIFNIVLFGIIAHYV